MIPKGTIALALLFGGCQVPSCGPPPNPERDPGGRARWIFRTAGEPATPVVLSDSSIVIGSARGRVVRLTADGAVRWSVDAGGPVVALARSADGRTVLVGAGRPDAGALVALDADRGRKSWERAVPGRAPRLAVRPDGVVVAASEDLWFFGAAGSANGSYDVGKELARLDPVVLQAGSTVVAMDDGTIVRLDAAGREERRFGDARLARARSLAATPDGRIAVIAVGHLALFDASGRDVLRLDGTYRGHVAPLPAGGFVVAGGDGRVSALGPDGRVRWRRNFERTRGEGEDREVRETPIDVAAASDGGAFVVVAKDVGDRLRQVVRLSPTGRVLWREKIVGLPSEARPVVLPHALLLPTSHWNRRIAKTAGTEIGHDRVTLFRD